jgi:hypothetical protein
MNKKAGLVALVVACAVAAVAGIAYGSVIDANYVVSACYKTRGGNLRVIDKDAGGACKKNETAIPLAAGLLDSKWVAVGVGGTAPMFDNGQVTVSLHCISNDSQLEIVSDEGDNLDIDGTQTDGAATTTVNTTTNSQLTLTGPGQAATLVISFHDTNATSGTTVITYNLWSQEATAGHNNNCFAQGQWAPSYG